MAHDFKKHPELTNNQMAVYYWMSPHKQIFNDFEGRVVKVHDGDTIHVKWEEREKPVVIRFLDTAAPEIDEPGGEKSRDWLASRILDKDVQVIVNPYERVGKWGRILGRIIREGIDINDESIRDGHAVPFDQRKEGRIVNLDKALEAFAI